MPPESHESGDAGYPTRAQMESVAGEYGFTIDEEATCSIQGVMIRYSRPLRDRETFLGLPVAGERQESEVIERHYCPGDADDEQMEVTYGRAAQRVIWEIEGYGR